MTRICDVPGIAEWRSRQLDDPRQDGEGDGRGHGPRQRRRDQGGGHYGAHSKGNESLFTFTSLKIEHAVMVTLISGRQTQAARELQPAADGQEVRGHGHHRDGGVRAEGWADGPHRDRRGRQPGRREGRHWIQRQGRG